MRPGPSRRFRRHRRRDPPCPHRFPRAEALFAYRYDDDGSDNWEAYLERTFDQSSGHLWRGHLLHRDRRLQHAGWIRSRVHRWTTRCTFLSRAMKSMALCSHKHQSTDTEAAVQQLEPDGDIGKNFFTFEDPHGRQHRALQPGLVTSRRSVCAN